jgi:hypothetical protein
MRRRVLPSAHSTFGVPDAGPATLGGMGQLIPSDVDFEALEPSESRVVRALANGTDDAWLILPHVPFVDRGREG